MIAVLIAFCVHFVSGKICYVKPEVNGNVSVCPAHPCEVLQYYVSNSSIIASSTTLIFLGGVHTLRTNFDFQKSVTLKADKANSIIICKDNAGFNFVNVTSLTIMKLTFQYCGTHTYSKRSALWLENIRCLKLIDVHVLNSSGFGVVITNLLGKGLIKGSTFRHNTGSSTYAGGNLFVEYNECPKYSDQTCFEIISSNFSYGNSFLNSSVISLAPGICLLFNASCTNSSVFMKNVTVEGNFNSIISGIGGNMLIHFYENYNSSVHILITESRFVSGRARFGGGVGITTHHSPASMTYPQIVVQVSNSDISSNEGVTGCGLYMEVAEPVITNNLNKLVVSFKNVTFLSNRAEQSGHSMGHNVGISIFILSGYVQLNWARAKIILDNITVSQSATKELHSATADSAAILCSRFMGHLTLSNSIISNNEVSALSLVNSEVTFFGKLVFSNNTGVNGGAVVACGSSYIKLAPKVKVILTENMAESFGGAIYATAPCRDSYPICLYQFTNISSTNMNEKYLMKNYNNSFILERNKAAIAGDHIYAENIANCIFYGSNLKFRAKFHMFYGIFQVPINSYGNYSAVTSNPFRVCACDSNSKYNCALRRIVQSNVTYPGKTINMSVVVVGQLDGTVPGSVLINGALKRDINSTQCSPLPITVIYNMSEYIVSVLYNRFPIQNFVHHLPTDSSPLIVQVTNISKCPIGFILVHDTCTCDTDNTGINSCNINNLTVTKWKGSWVGYNSISNHLYQNGIIYHRVCPLDYCRDESNIIIEVSDSTMKSDMQCSDHRTGLLCGSCINNYSVVVGSTRCIDCRKKPKLYALMVTVLLAIASLLLIFLSASLNMYVTNGTFSGLLLYVNILYQNNTVFKFTGTDILTVIVAVLNLDTGIESCFYDGMDTYAKTWFQLLIPVVLWLEILCIIAASRKSDKIAKFFGYNAPKVLATLIELSFNRALRACISSLSYTTLDFPSHNKTKITRYVWLYDANIDYLQGKHIPLFVAGGLVSFFLLAYTGLLLFVQPLQRYSHVYLLRWVNRLKPLIDAYTAPNVVKADCQFWGGLLLLTRISLSMYAAVEVHNKPTHNLVAIATVCLLLTTVAFTTGGVYQSVLLNAWNAVPILNLGILSILTVYAYVNNSRQVKHPQYYYVIVYTSVSLCVTMVGILTLYHVVKKIRTVSKKICSKCHILKAKNTDTRPLLNISQESICHSRPTH